MDFYDAVKAVLRGAIVTRDGTRDTARLVIAENGLLYQEKPDGEQICGICPTALFHSKWAEYKPAFLSFADAVGESQKGKLVKSESLGVYLISTRKRTIVCRHRKGDRYEDLASRYTKLKPEMVHACDWVVEGDRPNARKEVDNVPLPINKPTPQRRKKQKTTLL